MTISELQKQAHEIAKSKGWWNKERRWEEIVCTIHSEISEAFEEYRADRMDIYYAPLELPNGSLGKPEGFPIELADIVIRLMDWAEHNHESLLVPDEQSLALSHVLSIMRHEEEDDTIIIDYLHAVHGYLHKEFTGMIIRRECFRYTCLLANALDIDLESAILIKMEYNKTRSYRHGGKKA